jgi:hypothetical protein
MKTPNSFCISKHFHSHPAGFPKNCAGAICFSFSHGSDEEKPIFLAPLKLNAARQICNFILVFPQVRP